MRYVVVDSEDVVVNVIEYDGKAEFDPGEGLSLRKAKKADEPVDNPVAEVAAPLDPDTAQALRDALSSAVTAEEIKDAVLSVLAPMADEAADGV